MIKRHYSVFTKPWKTLSLQELGKYIREIGADGIELPLREGYQVDLNNVGAGLVEASKVLREYGVKITSVAAQASEEVFDACQRAEVPLIRVMMNFGVENGFWNGFDQARKQLEKAVPLCEKYKITLGVQHHYGTGIFNTMELYMLVKDFDPASVGAVWDAAHSALSGEDPIQALDIIRDQLCLVNFKTAFYRRKNGPEAQHGEFSPYFTTGRYGNTSWKKVVAWLQKAEYKGVFCLPAEYTDEERVDTYLRQDIEYLKSLVENCF